MHYLILFILLGCSSVTQKLDTSTIYRMDMDLKVNGRKANGLLVAENRASYDIEARSPGKLDLFLYSTCAREEYQEEAWDRGWFKSKYKTSFNYVPNKKIEKKNCDMLLAGAEKIKGRHSSGYVVFEESGYSLPANIICNGKESKANGSSACQTRKGILVMVEFNREVRGKSNCAEVEDKKKAFSFPVPRGECAIGFIDGDKRKHKMITFGYDEIPLRGD